MKRWIVPVALVASSALVAPAPADAGLLSGLAKLAKVGAKAGKAGKVAKLGSAVKGAKFLGAAVAAERVFAHSARSGSRVGVFVAEEGGALRVITAVGDDSMESVGGVNRIVGEFDEMAGATTDAGVDLYVDPSALSRLSELKIGKNTKLFLANTDGPSFPLRHVSGSLPEVGVGPDAWLRLAESGLELGFRLASQPWRSSSEQTLGLLPEGCGTETTSLDTEELREELQGGAGDVLIVAERDGDVLRGPGGTIPVAEILELAERHGIDAVVLGIDDACTTHEDGRTRALTLLTGLADAQTVGDVWTLLGTDAAPLVVDELEDFEGALRSSAASATLHMWSSVELPPLPVEATDDDDPPAWFIALGVLGLAVFAMLKLFPRRVVNLFRHGRFVNQVDE